MIVSHHLHHHKWLLVEQIYCWYCVGLGTTSLQNSVLYFVYIFYPFLIPLPLTVILNIVSVVAAASRYPVVTTTSSIFGVVVLVSITSHPRNHLEGFCVALSLMPLIWCVPPIDWHWGCASSSGCWGGISIRFGWHHIRMRITREVIV